MTRLLVTICSVLACSFADHDGELSFLKDLTDNALVRNRRQLLFPNTTLLQLNIGISTPTPDKRIAANWAFQANFNLPWNTTQIPLGELTSAPVVSSKRKRDEQSDSSEHIVDYGGEGRLHLFYKYLEDILNGFGHNGKECVLKALCELAAEPLDADNEDVLQEITTFITNPNNEAHYDILQEYEAKPYIEAYNNGKGEKNCRLMYDTCPLSLVDLFTILQ